MTEIRHCVLAAASAMLLSSAAAVAGVPESNDSIKLMHGNWSSINIQAQIAGQILQKLSYMVHYIPIDDSARYPAFEKVPS